MGKKSTNIIKEMRIKQVMSMLVQGTYDAEIVSVLSKEWECSIRNVQMYLKVVREMMHDHFMNTTAEDIKAKHLYLYNWALTDNDKKEARANLEDLARLSGFNKDKVEHSGTIAMPPEIIINRPDDKRKEE